MKIYLFRHGFPNYEKDCLTKLGKKQVRAITKITKNINFDYIYTSSCGRAVETSLPTSKLQNKKPIIIDWAREDLGWKYYADPKERRWYFYSDKYYKLLQSKEIFELGSNYLNHKKLKNTLMSKGYEIMRKDTEAWLKELGLKRNSNNRGFKKIKNKTLPNNVALFAHGAFAFSFLSNLLDIPYPIFVSTFGCIDCASVTIIDFDESKGMIVPKIISYNDINHLKSIKHSPDDMKA